MGREWGGKVGGVDKMEKSFEIYKKRMPIVGRV